MSFNIIDKWVVHNNRDNFTYRRDVRSHVSTTRPLILAIAPVGPKAQFDSVGMEKVTRFSFHAQFRDRNRVVFLRKRS